MLPLFVLACGGSTTGSGSGTGGIDGGVSGSGGVGATSAGGGPGQAGGAGTTGTSGTHGGESGSGAGGAGAAAGTGGHPDAGGGAGGTKPAVDAGASGAAGTSGTAGGGNGVACGPVTCSAPDACLVCDPLDPNTERSCVEGFSDGCGIWGPVPPLRLFCDDAGVCASTERCAIIEGSVGTYAQCLESPDCAADCSCTGGSANVRCGTVADCPQCAKSCAPYRQYPDGPEYPVNVCTW